MPKFFPSTYPILCAAMNKVSEVTLAIACSNAGIFPSISMLCYVNENNIDWNKFEQELVFYNSSTKNNNLLISVPDTLFLNEKFQQLLDKKLFSHLEIICINLTLCDNITLSEHDHFNFKKLQHVLTIWKHSGYKFLYKSLARFVIYDIVKHYGYDLFDAFVLKGPNAAGMVVDRRNSNTLYDDITEIVKRHSDIIIIPSGGIGSKQQIDQYLDLGIDCVAIGTLFAASIESTISNTTKLQMIAHTATDLNRFKISNQNALVFSKIDKDDFNHTISLVEGIKTGNTGHIFAGSGIENIKKITSTLEIVQELTHE